MTLALGTAKAEPSQSILQATPGTSTSACELTQIDREHDFVRPIEVPKDRSGATVAGFFVTSNLFHVLNIAQTCRSFDRRELETQRSEIAKLREAIDAKEAQLGKERQASEAYRAAWLQAERAAVEAARRDWTEDRTLWLGLGLAGGFAGCRLTAQRP